MVAAKEERMAITNMLKSLRAFASLRQMADDLEAAFGEAYVSFLDAPTPRNLKIYGDMWSPELRLAVIRAAVTAAQLEASTGT